MVACAGVLVYQLLAGSLALVPIVLFIGFCLGLATLAGFFGGSWWVLDLFAGFRHQLAAGLLVCALIAVLAKWHKSAAVIGLLAIVNLALIVPLFLGPSRPESSDLRILSFNVLGSNRRFDEVIDFIRDTDADVVVLHEVTGRWEEAIADASQTFDDWNYEVTETRAGGNLFGSLVLTRARCTGGVLRVRGDRSPSGRDPPARRGGGARGSPAVSFQPLPGRAERPPASICHRLGLEQAGPAIVVGDFNATPWSYPFRRLMASTDLSNSESGFGLDLSYPADRNPLFRIPIDHLLHSRRPGGGRPSIGTGDGFRPLSFDCRSRD